MISVPIAMALVIVVLVIVLGIFSFIMLVTMISSGGTLRKEKIKRREPEIVEKKSIQALMMDGEQRRLIPFRPYLMLGRHTENGEWLLAKAGDPAQVLQAGEIDRGAESLLKRVNAYSYSILTDVRGETAIQKSSEAQEETFAGNDLSSVRTTLENVDIAGIDPASLEAATMAEDALPEALPPAPEVLDDETIAIHLASTADTAEFRPVKTPTTIKSEEPKRNQGGSKLSSANSVAAQVDVVLQTLLNEQEEITQDLHIDEAPDGDLRIWVGAVHYHEISEIPDPKIAAILRKAAEQWADGNMPRR